jgi:putative transposase
MEGPIDMAIDKALLNQLLAGREPQDLLAKGGLIDHLKKALSERIEPPRISHRLQLPNRMEGL